MGVIFGSPEITSGGNALKFYSSVRLDIRRRETLRDGKNADRGIRVRVKVTKNKVAPPYKLAEFDILFDRGIAKEASPLDVAEMLGIMDRKGSWYSYGGENVAQGRERAAQALLEDPDLRHRVEADVEAALEAQRMADAAAVPGAGGQGRAGGADEEGEGMTMEDALAAPGMARAAPSDVEGAAP